MIATRYTGHLLHRSNPNLYPCHYAVIMRENNKLIAKVPMVSTSQRGRDLPNCALQGFLQVVYHFGEPIDVTRPASITSICHCFTQNSIDTYTHTHTQGDPWSRKLLANYDTFLLKMNDPRDKFWRPTRVSRFELTKRARQCAGTTRRCCRSLRHRSNAPNRS